MNAVLLCRVSTGKESQETSTDRQLARLEQVAKVRGWRVVARLLEQESGRTMKRKAVDQALELVRKKKAKIIVVDHLFRFGRNVKEMLEAVDELEACGGHLYELDKHLDTTAPNGRLMFTWFAAIGEYYSRESSRKIKEGQARARQRGAVIGRPRSIDYTRTDDAQRLRNAGDTWEQIAKTLGGSPGAWSRRLSRSAAAA
jgi:DNA invertase Pin-like site-specific DNA recombinase